MFKKLFNAAKIFKRAFGQHKKVLVLLFFLSFLNSILEGVGISALIPFFSFIGHNQFGNTDLISRSIENFFIYLHIPFTLKFLLIFVLSLFILKAIVLFFTNFIAALVTTSYEKNLRSNLFKLTLYDSWPHLIKQKVGHLDQLLVTDINCSSSLISSIVTGALMFTKLVVYVLVAINLSIPITLFALILGLLTFFIFKPFFYKNQIMSRRASNMYKDLAHFVNENIIGMKTVKSMFVEKSVIERGKKYFEELRSVNLKVAVSRHITHALMQPIGFIFIIAIFSFSYKTNIFNFASFVVIVYAINQIFTQIQSGQAHLHGMISSAPYLMNIINYQEIARQNIEEDKGNKKFVFNNNLELADVNFSYNSNQETLRHINLLIKKGDMIGLVGHSGAGKTTMVDLLLRLFQPDSGNILLDGSNINDFSLREWRTNVGYVSQDIFLLNDTIENNIKFYNNSLTKKEVEKFAKIANIFDFVSSLPDKFSAVIGERGILLSGGQRQRIILARILAKNPKILILDEATSALDNESEIQIQKAIENLKGKITVLAIAHRLTTVKNCDRIIVLKDGEIIENGEPKELLNNKNSAFYEMYNIKNNS
ncbi:MAG: ABC transporter ATP-binding protein [Patescibacteria group bacterium]|jgi:ATP-binding cassette subfamily C protein